MKQGNHDGAGMERHLHDPVEDRLIPLEPLDLTHIRSIDDLVRAMAKTAFTGRVTASEVGNPELTRAQTIM